ncbi:DUF6233 domain-containing protein [Streptomyces sp. NPDC056400]|uniref:DUF6233 domain-containing protein n=1 Tax=Streptomyces sp. NPDC056400 TaxID=3345808 RepID=UPI0035DD8984
MPRPSSSPSPTESLIENGIDVRPPPIRVHIGNCRDTRSRYLPVERGDTHRTLADRMEACLQCRPDSTLGLLD